MATIITKNSSTASSVPLNTQLVQGELAVNVTDKRLFTENASGTVVELGTNPSTLVTSNTFLAFGRGNTEDMRLTSTGLGIGTSSPSTKLQVRDTSAATSNTDVITISTDNYAGNANRRGGVAWTDNSSVVGRIYTNYTGSTMDMVFGSLFNGSYNTNELMRLTGSGNLGLGVTPSAWGLSGLSAMQIRNGGLYGYDVTEVGVTGNCYYGSSAWRYIGSGQATRATQVNGQHLWYTAPSGTAGNAITFTQAMTLDANGNLLLGTTSSSVKLDVIASGSGSGKCAFRALADNGQILLGNAGTFDSYLDSNQWIFRTSPQNGQVERARIDSSGNLLVGTTSAGGQAGLSILPNNSNGAATLFWDRASTASTSTALNFENGNSTVGSVTYTNTGTAYNTSSDYRLKENIQPMTGALAKVAALKPCTYKWKSDGSDGEGFIAHELAEVVPQAVTGEKDAVDAEGNPIYQGIDTSFLVATLTAAIQEQQAIINAQSAALEQLKAQLTSVSADVAALKAAA